MMNQEEKRAYNRAYGIANKARIEANRAARRAGLSADVRRCSVPGCDGVYDARGYCARHYMEMRRRESTLPPLVKGLQACGVEGCSEPHDSHGFCRRHVRAFLRHGDPTIFVHKVTRRDTAEERFFLQTEKGPGCWNWIGNKNKDGYGGIRVNGSSMLAHRFSYILANGAIPSGMGVLHRCDNPSCVNPDHLFLGTQGDNISDMYAKGRENVLRGARHHNVKLDEAAVMEIRQMPGAARLAAERFGISEGAVRHIRSGRTWKHLK